MKRVTGILLCICLFCSFAIPAMAADKPVAFAKNSSFDVGATVKVDELKTQRNIMDLGADAAQYNAALEGNMQYYWFRNDSYYKDGPSITLTAEDRGCQFFCRVYLFEDADRTVQCGVYDSETFTVPNAVIPEITTKSLPNGIVGQAYYQKLECTDSDVVFSLFRSSLPDGLYLTQHGEIEGTPAKAGFWHVVVMATPEAGEDYATTKEYDIEITEPEPEYTLEIMEVPDKLTYTAGEKLDMTGLWVRIYTPDGFIDSRDGKNLTYSQKELVTLGEQKIKLTYQDAFEFFIVTVVAAPEEKPTEPDTKPTDPSEPDASEPTEPDVAEPTKPSESEKPSYNTDTPATGTTPSSDQESQNNEAMPWWGVLLIALGAAGAGVGVTIMILKKKKA